MPNAHPPPPLPSHRGPRNARRVTGMTHRAALKTVHARPPKRGTANVYGIRSAEPIRFGSAIRMNDSDSESVKPTFARLITTIVHNTQTENPRFAAKIEKARFF